MWMPGMKIKLYTEWKSLKFKISKGKQFFDRNAFLPAVTFTQLFVATADYLYYFKYREYNIVIQEFTCWSLISSVFIICYSGSFTELRRSALRRSTFILDPK
jgi:hypothetical protein